MAAIIIINNINSLYLAIRVGVVDKDHRAREKLGSSATIRDVQKLLRGRLVSSWDFTLGCPLHVTVDELTVNIGSSSPT